jgi:hypothetical protein
MPVSQIAQPLDDCVEVGRDQPQCVANPQHERRIDDIRRGGAFVKRPLKLRVQPRLYGLDERDRRDSGDGCAQAERGDVEIVGADCIDGGGERFGCQAELMLAAGESAFDRQHATDPGPVAEAGAHRLGCEQWPE